MNDDDVVALARALGALRVEFAEMRRAVQTIAEAVAAVGDRIEKLEGEPEQGVGKWLN